MHDTIQATTVERVSLKNSRDDAVSILRWFKTEARPFFEKHAADVLPPLDNDVNRLEKILARPDHVTVCFLGHSGVGKSTLLNALVAGDGNVLPAGGIGPLTALATEVTHSDQPQFQVRYHKRNRLWRLVFALERINEVASAATAGPQRRDIPLTELNDEERKDLQGKVTPVTDAEGHSVESSAKVFLKQAQQIITGDQFGDRPLPYLIDGLRMACGYAAIGAVQPDDLARIERVQNALAFAEKGTAYERHDDKTTSFAKDLKDHAAGFLAPIIERIQVGWPSTLLHRGLTLVDLPGVGIAQDVYRQITQNYIRAFARAVILTVDRAGLTGETIELLRNSGYWDRLVGAVDDPASDPCNLFIVVTKVDDVASQEWRDWSDGAATKPKRREIYATTVTNFKERMRSQIVDQLGNIGASNNTTLQDARSRAKSSVLDTLQIHPVSAPEYRKILTNNEDDRPFLSNQNDTGIPELSDSLARLATEERTTTAHDIEQVMQRFRDAAGGELRRLEAMWRSRTQAAQIEEGLKRDLDAFLAESQKERYVRMGAFREFLESTSQSRIKQLVAEAREIAEDEVNQFLRSLRNAHWATLKAAVTRGGSFHGQRDINLPEDIAIRFQEPVAAVWSTKLLVDVRKRTSEFATDHTRLVDELCNWARDKTQSNSQTELIEQQRQRIARHADQMRQVGKEAVGDLRQTVKLKISDAVRKPIRRACEKFVENGDHVGQGVKSRILELFDNLAKQSTKAAEEPSTKILEKNFTSVRSDIKAVFDDWGDPLQETADIILQKSREDIEIRSDVDREATLCVIEALLAADSLSRDDMTKIK